MVAGIEQLSSELFSAVLIQLEELEDVQDVYANFDIPDEILEKLES